MPSSLSQRLDAIPRKSVSASLPKSESARATGNRLSDHEIARRFGRAIERAMDSAGITPQDAQHDLGYANQSPISKLVNPSEPPALAKLMTLPGFTAAWIEVLAENCPEYRKRVTLERTGS